MNLSITTPTPGGRFVHLIHCCCLLLIIYPAGIHGQSAEEDRDRIEAALHEADEIRRQLDTLVTENADLLGDPSEARDFAEDILEHVPIEIQFNQDATVTLRAGGYEVIAGRNRSFELSLRVLRAQVMNEFPAVEIDELVEGIVRFDQSIPVVLGSDYYSVTDIGRLTDKGTWFSNFGMSWQAYKKTERIEGGMLTPLINSVVKLWVWVSSDEWDNKYSGQESLKLATKEDSSPTGEDGRSWAATGFFASYGERYFLLTNLHVIHNRSEAESATFAVNFQHHVSCDSSPMPQRVGTVLRGRCRLSAPYDWQALATRQPLIDFMSEGGMVIPDPELDWIAVELDRLPENVVAVQIPTEAPMLQNNQEVFLIHHPLGGPKRISYFDSFIIDTDTNNLRHTADTLGGSSGSPIFSTSGDLLGVHKSTVGWCQRDVNGQRLMDPRNEGRCLRDWNNATRIDAIADTLQRMLATARATSE